MIYTCYANSLCYFYILLKLRMPFLVPFSGAKVGAMSILVPLWVLGLFSWTGCSILKQNMSAFVFWNRLNVGAIHWSLWTLHWWFKVPTLGRVLAPFHFLKAGAGSSFSRLIASFFEDPMVLFEHWCVGVVVGGQEVPDPPSPLRLVEFTQPDHILLLFALFGCFGSSLAGIITKLLQTCWTLPSYVAQEVTRSTTLSWCPVVRDFPSCGFVQRSHSISLLISIVTGSPSNFAQMGQTIAQNVARDRVKKKHVVRNNVLASWGPRPAVSSDLDLIHPFMLPIHSAGCPASPTCSSLRLIVLSDVKEASTTTLGFSAAGIDCSVIDSARSGAYHFRLEILGSVKVVRIEKRELFILTGGFKTVPYPGVT